ncbi:hypothetical protein ACUWCT_28580, partial [Klebsiella pneumoniae]
MSIADPSSSYNNHSQLANMLHETKSKDMCIDVPVGKLYKCQLIGKDSITDLQTQMSVGTNASPNEQQLLSLIDSNVPTNISRLFVTTLKQFHKSFVQGIYR